MQGVEKNNVRMAKWVCNIRSDDRISTEELRIRLNWLAWGIVYMINDCNDVVVSEERKGRACKVSGSVFRGRPRKT